tara:strand:+ start:2588 stop:3688 length:1101 start_codon:yes stop_codon:yes gene_type:complete
MTIPFVDLKSQYKNLKKDIDFAIQNVIEDTAFIKGKYVKKFEKEFAQAYGVKHCISCANGTDALYISMKALDIGQGDEVITVANSWISTSQTISQTGAKPVFIDIEPGYYTIDIDKIESKINKNTKAIIPVHLFGQPCSMDKIVDLCKSYNLNLIEDCAQAHFAKLDNKNVGTFGISGTFSFFPGKNLGAYGDAGAIITNNEEFATKARMFANHGALIKHSHEIEGINSRLDGLQAAILSVKLKKIKNWNKKRLDNANYYNELFSFKNKVSIPLIRSRNSHVFHLYVIRTKKREKLIQKLKKLNIATSIHYPTPLPFLKAYSYLNCSIKDFPVAFDYSEKILSLPIYPELTKDKIEFVVDSVEAAI